MVYNAFLKWVALTKFMAIPHYAYLILKMPGPHGVISIRGDVKCAYDCDKESYETIDRLTTATELQELEKAEAEPPPPSEKVEVRLPRSYQVVLNEARMLQIQHKAYNTMMFKL
jgi:hypothetical protein